MPRKPTETVILKGGCDKCPFYYYDKWGAHCNAGCVEPTGEPPPTTCPLRRKNIKVTYA